MSGPPAISGYSIQSELGAGGQGSVYRATHLASGQVVALKVVPEQEPELVQRFHQEARVLRALRHPNLLTVFDHGQQQGLGYLAIELIEGDDLRTLIGQSGMPPADWIGRVLATMAHTLQFCHENGVVHRDLKPANVLIERTTQRPVLVDFGLVKRDPSRLTLQSLDDGGPQQLTQEGDLIGTPEYMAPEQVNADRYGGVGPRTDVYALGATLYHVLTGKAPFKGRASVLILRKVTSKAPVDPRELNPQAPAALSELCMRCLAKLPAERPVSAAELAALLAQAAGIPPVPDPRTQGADPRIAQAAQALRLSLDDSAASGKVRLPKRAAPRAGETLAGYVLERELARGASGAVFVARKGEQLRAIKVLLGDVVDETAAERFRREVEAGRDLRHPNVARVFESGVQDGVAWLCMEYLEGAVPLDEYVFSRQLPLGERLRLIEQLADGVQAAHQAGLIHRDLKPDNALVLPSGQVKVIDFGIARHVEKERLTLSGLVMGTVSYMAPEQVRGRSAHVDARTDVYALGVILYQLIREELPFEGGTNVEVMAAILEDTPPPACAELAEPPAGLDDVVLMAMAKDPEERYPTAAAFGRDLAAAASGSGDVSAFSRSRVRRRNRWLGRVVVAAALIGGVGGAAVWWTSRPTTLSPKELEDASSDVARRASELLAKPGLLADASEASADLERRLAELRASVPEGQAPPRRLARATARVVAAQGLVSLASGDRAAAQARRDELEGIDAPEADALRGGLLVSEDPREAIRLLSRGMGRGLKSAELHRWRTQAQVRVGLGDRELDQVERALEILRTARGGKLAPDERPFEVWVLLARGEQKAAKAALAELTATPVELKWSLVLAHAAPLIEKLPPPTQKEQKVPLLRAVEPLADLEPPSWPLPEVPGIVERIQSQLAALSRRRLESSTEGHTLGLLRMLRAIAPNARIPGPVTEGLVEATAGMLRGVPSNAGCRIAADLAAANPENFELNHTTAMKIQSVRSTLNKRVFLPSLRRSIELSTDPERARALREVLADALAFIGVRPGGEVEAKQCLEECERLLALEERGVRRAWILCYRAMAKRGLADDVSALADIQEALEIGFHTDFLYHRAALLRILERDPDRIVDDSLRYLEDQQDATNWSDAACVNVWEFAGAQGRWDLVDRAVTHQLVLRSDHPGWKLRFAYVRLKRGGELKGQVADELHDAVQHANRIASWAAWWSSEDREKKLEDISKRLRAGEDVRADVVAFVEELEKGRKANSDKNAARGRPMSSP